MNEKKIFIEQINKLLQFLLTNINNKIKQNKKYMTKLFEQINLFNASINNENSTHEFYLNIAKKINDTLIKFEKMYLEKSFELFNQLNDKSQKITLIPGLDFSKLNILFDNEQINLFWNYIDNLCNATKNFIKNSIELNENPYIGIQGVDEKNYNINSFCKNFESLENKQSENQENQENQNDTLLQNMMNKMGVNGNLLNDVTSNIVNLSDDDLKLAKENVKKLCGCNENDTSIDNIVDTLKNEIKNVDFSQGNLYDNIMKLANNVTQNTNDDDKKNNLNNLEKNAETYVSNIMSKMNINNTFMTEMINKFMNK
jgi:hypothetical protein